MGQILRAAQFDGYTNKKDRTMSLRFVTQEMSPNEVAEIHGMIDTFGYLLFKSEHEISPEEVAKLNALQTELTDNPNLTPSKRMKNVLYRIWEKNPSGFQRFPDYYVWRMEMIIKGLKEALGDLEMKGK